jgi:hypothetical protein
MKVKNLIATLETIDPEAEILMSSDAEGNALHEPHEITELGGTSKTYVLWPQHDDIAL